MSETLQEFASNTAKDLPPTEGGDIGQRKNTLVTLISELGNRPTEKVTLHDFRDVLEQEAEIYELTAQEMGNGDKDQHKTDILALDDGISALMAQAGKTYDICYTVVKARDNERISWGKRREYKQYCQNKANMYQDRARTGTPQQATEFSKTAQLYEKFKQLVK